MSSTLTIPSNLPPIGAGGSTAQIKTAEPAPPFQAAKPAPLYVNPDFKFDPSIGVVVIEFHNDTGQLTNSIPNQRQLDAYRLHQTPLPGQTQTAKTEVPTTPE